MTERTIKDIEDRLAIYKSAKAKQDEDDLAPVTPAIITDISARAQIMASLRRELKEDLKASVALYVSLTPYAELGDNDPTQKAIKAIIEVL